MKTNLLFSLSISIFLIINACSSAPEKPEQSTFADTAVNDTAEAYSPIAQAEKKVQEQQEKKLKSIPGSYIGILPCPNCEGIKTMVVLNDDNTYLMKTAFQGKKDRTVHETKGNYTYDAISRKISLDGAEGPSQYLFKESYIIQLDKNGKENKTEKPEQYHLKKMPM